MIDPKQFTFAIAQIAEEKNIPEEKIIDVLESAIAAAYKKDYGEKSQMIKSHLNKETGAFDIYQHKLVVTVDEEGYITDEESLDEEGNPRQIRFNPDRHIPLAEAKEVNPEIKEGEEVVEQLEPRDEFGRVAAQTAKQVLMQRIREIERSTAFEEYKDRVGEIVTGTIQRADRGIVYVELGKGVGLLFPSEQVRSDNYRVGNRYKFYIQSVEETDRDPNILLSRKSTDFVKTLFSLEVPEVFGGTVEIMGVARDAGVRTKLSVKANGEGIDPVGSCVGQRGTRVQTIIGELGGEKIDIIEYSENIQDYIRAAIAPAQVMSITINEEDKKAQLVVPSDQLSLAIGGRGQNVRLASQLTGYNLDLHGDQDLPPVEEEVAPAEAPVVETMDSEELDTLAPEESGEGSAVVEAQAPVEEAAPSEDSEELTVGVSDDAVSSDAPVEAETVSEDQEDEIKE